MFARLAAEYLFPPIGVISSSDDDDEDIYYQHTGRQRVAIALIAIAELSLYVFLIQHSIATDFLEGAYLGGRRYYLWYRWRCYWHFPLVSPPFQQS